MGSGISKERLGLLTSAMERIADGVNYAGVVTQVWHGNALVHEDCIGLMDIERATPMRRDAIFRIASMTKPIISVAALMLLEEGKLTLGDAISRWIPEMADMPVLRTVASPLSDTVPANRPITVLDLMTHRSGIPYDFSCFGELQAAIAPFRGDGVSSPLAPDEWVAAMGRLPLLVQPGTAWHYGFSTDVLGVLIARIEGEPLPDVLKRRIFDPLGMMDTGFHVPQDKLDRLTVGYMRDVEGKIAIHDDPQASRFGKPPAFPAGGGGLVSTADDYARFALMLLNQGSYGGVRILGRKTVETMSRNWLTDEQNQPLIPQIDFLRPHGFGLGVSVIGPGGIDNCVSSPGKIGWPGAYTTRWFADPSEDLVAVMMTQMWFDVGGKLSPTFDTLVCQALEQ